MDGLQGWTGTDTFWQAIDVFDLNGLSIYSWAIVGWGAVFREYG